MSFGELELIDADVLRVSTDEGGHTVGGCKQFGSESSFGLLTSRMCRRNEELTPGSGQQIPQRPSKRESF